MTILACSLVVATAASRSPCAKASQPLLTVSALAPIVVSLRCVLFWIRAETRGHEPPTVDRIEAVHRTGGLTPWRASTGPAVKPVAPTSRLVAQSAVGG